MVSIPGFWDIQEVHFGQKSAVYRARRALDNQAVVLKVPTLAFPGRRMRSRILHEYEIARLLQDLNCVPKYFNAWEYPKGIALVMEDTGGLPLHHRSNAGEAMPVAEFLKLAVEIAKAIGAIHSAGVIHKDIKPGNILVHKDGTVHIVDFGSATRLSQETGALVNPGTLEGTLAYMSPEQTGRMNRVVDYRTDLYSFGITCYELITGSPPFESDDNMEMVHAHIARVPQAPHERNADVPKPLSRIIMKLLEKTAEQRYQSAAGVAADFEYCLEHLDALRSGGLDDFEIGRRDQSGNLQIPQKLYGRETEIENLLEAYERVSEGATELMLVAGYSGIGKSALVQEVHKPIVRSRGYFISGKFDQYKRDIPYASLIQAFQELVRQLLTESGDNIASWKTKILEALGANGRVITDVIPEVELITGAQPAVPELPPGESQNRFNSVFTDFVRVFAQQEHPLTIFLDDLQWADSASLALLKMLVTDAETEYLFVIGAYRDNEVDDSHPFMLTLSEIQGAGATVHSIFLRALGREHITNLLCDALTVDGDTAGPLADLILDKTGGNPFFVNQFLRTLAQEKLLFFDPAAGWKWDVASIRSQDITDNVVELMAGKIQKLSANTQKILKIAACLGNQFDLDTLARVTETENEKAAEDLWEPLREGLVVPLNVDYKYAGLGSSTKAEASASETGDAENAPERERRTVVSYKFLHDRVQQAAYSLLDPGEAERMHLGIGRLLFANFPKEEINENIFAIVNQYNHGAEKLVTDSEEKLQLARLNLRAGYRAKASTAYQSALRYLKTGMDLMPADAWDSLYDLAFVIHFERGECEYLAGNFDAAAEFYDIILEKAHSNIERARVFRTQVTLYDAMGRYEEALQAGIKGLQLFGIEFPENQRERRKLIVRGLKGVRELLGDREVKELINHTRTEDPEIIATMELLITISNVTYAMDKELNFLTGLRMALLSMENGNTHLSAHGYSFYGAMLCGMGDEQNIKTGHEFGLLGQELNRIYDNRALTAKINAVFGWFINHWRRHARESVPKFEEGYRAGHDLGDYTYCGLNLMEMVATRFHIGENLDRLQETAHKSLEMMRRFKYEEGILIVETEHRKILALRDMTDAPPNFSTVTFSEEEHEQNLSRFAVSREHYHVSKLVLHFLFGDFAKALEYAERSEEHTVEIEGIYRYAEWRFYYCLTLAALYDDAGAEQREEYKERFLKHHAVLQRWAKLCPENTEHKFLLIEAELARIEDRRADAIDLYDQAIESARINDYVQNAALAAELTARFYLRDRKNRIAEGYLLEASWGYETWGAQALVRRLAQTYPEIFANHRRSQNVHETTTSSSSESAALDLSTVVKSSLAISGEIVLGDLISKIMGIMMENAGASRGFFITPDDDGELFIEAGGEGQSVQTFTNRPLSEEQNVAQAIVNYVARTGESAVLQDAAADPQYATDPYVERAKPRSVLCSPVLSKGQVVGVIYLENNLTTGAFTEDRLEVLGVLSAQAAVSLENARLYSSLEQKVAERTEQLAKLNEFSKKVNSMTGVDEVIEEILEYIRENFATVDGMLVGLMNENRDELFFYRSVLPEGLPPETLQFIKDIRIPMNADEGGLIYLACQKKRRIALKKLRTTGSAADDLFVQNIPANSAVVYPLIIQNEALGVIATLNFRKGEHLSREEIDTIGSYAEHISGAVNSSTLLQEAREAQRKADDLLLNILPRRIADELKDNGKVEPMFFESVSLMFMDFKGFTKIASRQTPAQLVATLDQFFLQFDQIMERYNIEKLKTIGDAYMAAGGLPEPNRTHPVDVCRSALEVQAFMKQAGEISRQVGEEFWELRIGIHSGPAMAGIIGKNKFAYDVWGDAVNVAARMEANSQPGRINISEDTYRLVEPFFEVEHRGIFEIKNRGKIGMYFLNRIRPELSKDDEGLVPNGAFHEKLFEVSMSGAG